VKSTKIDLAKAQITVTDPQGEMKIEKVDGKKVLTAKDPQGRLLFSGPVDSKEDLDKVPADVRQRFEKVEQKDLPGVISTVAVDTEENADEDNDRDDQEDADDANNDNSDDSDVSVQQVSCRFVPRSFRTFNLTSI
jgi:hypothetical protein